MKKIIVLTLAICVFPLFYSCNSGTSTKKIDKEVYSEYLQKGSEISNIAQGVLLANVGKAIQKGGTEFAVEFCNLNASSIIDSLNHQNNCDISRVSAKNRNPENAIQEETEKNIWAYFSDKSKHSTDTIIGNGEKLVYFKPITIGMPACLKCHGIPGQNIEPSTYEMLQKLYPNDLAINYQMNDFRGFWKIVFNNPE